MFAAWQRLGQTAIVAAHRHAGASPGGARGTTARDRTDVSMDLQERLAVALPVVRDAADGVDAEAGFPAESMRALADAGLLGVGLDPAAGGAGGGPSEVVDAVEAVASGCGSTAMVYLMHLAAMQVTAAAPPVGDGGLVAALGSGETLGTLAFSESGSRSHFWAPVSQARRRDGRRIGIEADKSWVTSASHADVFVVSAQSPDATSPTESNLYVVARTAPGVEVTGRFDGLGLRGNDSSPIRLDVEIDEAARLGADKAGFGLMMQVVLPWFNLGNAAVSVGLARAALDAATAHASRSRLAHLDSTLADMPTIRAYLAKAWTDLAAHDALLRETARRVAVPDEGTPLLVLGAKAACNEMALRVTETALRVAGGAGFSKQVGIDRPYRDARAGFVMAPTSDALYDFAGRALCGMELF
jgi:alkylation response protein AidB-like acyl-CoA dehydrogenase